MRQYVRAWINEWDLVRLDPVFRPQTEVVEIASDYREDSALEDPDPDGCSDLTECAGAWARHPHTGPVAGTLERSTRSEPCTRTSVNAPEASARR